MRKVTTIIFCLLSFFVSQCADEEVESLKENSAKAKESSNAEGDESENRSNDTIETDGPAVPAAEDELAGEGQVDESPSPSATPAPVEGIVLNNLLLHLDAASFAVNGQMPSPASCALPNWSNTSIYSLNANMMGFTSCGSTLGWQGSGSPAAPFHVATNGTGVDEYVSIPGDANVQNVQNADYTVEVWVHPNSLPQGSGSINTSTYGLLVRPGNHSGLVFDREGRFSLIHFQVGGVATTVKSSVMTPGSWYHVVGTVSPSTGQMRIYVNGRTEGYWSFSPTAATWNYGTNPWYVGIANPGAASYRWSADARINTARIYRSVLSAADVSKNCNAQKARFLGLICN